MGEDGRRDSDSRNGVLKTLVTAVVSALVGAVLVVLMNSSGVAVGLERSVGDIEDLKHRMLAVEQAGAQDHAKLQALESKVDDIWKVVVLGERPPHR